MYSVKLKPCEDSLPASTEELASRYPDYFAQAAIYLGLAQVLPEYAGIHAPCGALLYRGRDRWRSNCAAYRS